MTNDIDNQTDTEVVSLVVGGDVAAYAEIMQRYEAKLHRYVTYLIHDPTMANDAVQETFIKAYQNLQGFNPKYKFSSWIYRIAHNSAINMVKKDAHLSDEDITELPDTSYDQNIDELMDEKILKNHVQECLGQLEPKYREVIQLVYFEHMKYSDVSDVLHIPVSTVGVWLSRAKERLKELCEQKGVKR